MEDKEKDIIQEVTFEDVNKAFDNAFNEESMAMSIIWPIKEE